MKVKITKADAEAFILNRFQRSGLAATSVEIEDFTKSPYIGGIQTVTSEFPRHNADQKIAAIKRLRELVPGLGLGDAKRAVENPTEAIRHFQQSGTVLAYQSNW